jgi:c-di-GMP-binding flagellar brake protein YcgR
MSSTNQNRRENPRFKVRIPIEFRPEDSEIPMRGATADLSLGGCYVEMMFTFPVETKLEMSLRVGDRTMRVMATVVTRDLQVGNGIKFVGMLPEHRKALRLYLDAAEKHQAKSAGSDPGAR